MTAELPQNVEVEHVSIEPAEGNEDVILPEGAEAQEEGTDPDAEGGEEEAPAGPKETIVRRQPVTPAPVVATGTVEDPNSTERLPGETPKEYALRQELTKTRGLLREQRGQEILGGNNSPAAPVAPANNEVLAKYKPEEINALKEVIGALGYVKADQLQAGTYSEKGQSYLDAFLDKHPEYNAENDKDGKLWEAFKSEFGIYKQPADPKDFPRIFNKVHATVFGIQPTAGAGGKTAAANEKVTVASRGSAPAPTGAAPSVRQRPSAPGVRKDMLKGFSEEELAEMGLE